jgi:hypothetical protein
MTELWVIQVDPDYDGVIAGFYFVHASHFNTLMSFNRSFEAARVYPSEQEAQHVIDTLMSVKSSKMLPPLKVERLW